MLTISYIENFPKPLYPYAKHTSVHPYIATMPYPTLHNHSDYWEIIIVTKGKILNVESSGKSICLPSGTLHIVRPNDEHFIAPDSEKGEISPFQYFNIAIKSSLLEAQFNLIDRNLFETIFNADTNNLYASDLFIAKTEQLIHSIHIVPFEDYKRKEKCCMALFLHLFDYIYSHYNPSSHNKPAWVAKIDAWFENQENLKAKVSDLCKMLSYSRTHLNRLFQEYYHKSPSRYLAELKMSYAAMFLESTDFSIADISMRIGYASFSRFDKIFKEFYKLSPREYKNHTKHF